MKTIVINGANGYVASNFISSLLKQKFKVIALVRANKTLSPAERMQKVLDDINEDGKVDTSNLQVFSYSLLEKDFGLMKNEMDLIFNNDIDYFHFAASLKYDEKSKKEIFATNIDGVTNSVSVFQKYATAKSRFFYIGTAYSCGVSTKIFEEKFYDNEPISAFRNYYELSKRYGENVVRNYIEEQKFNGHIIRLSQVVGDCKTGVTKTDYGIFDFAKRLFSLSNRYPNEVIRIHVDPESTQNLIPIDTVVEYLSRTVHTPSLPVIMNFASKKSVKNGFIIKTLDDLLPLTLIPLKDLDKKEMNSIERLIAIGMSFTDSYTEINLKFDTSARDLALNLNGKYELNDREIGNMLSYFVDNLSKRQKKIVA